MENQAPKVGKEKQTQIQDMKDVIDSALLSLEDSINTLNEKLSGILLRPGVPVEKKDEGEEPVLVPLASELRYFYKQVANANDNIIDITQRVEL